MTFLELGMVLTVILLAPFTQKAIVNRGIIVMSQSATIMECPCGETVYTHFGDCVSGAFIREGMHQSF